MATIVISPTHGETQEISESAFNSLVREHEAWINQFTGRAHIGNGWVIPECTRSLTKAEMTLARHLANAMIRRVNAQSRMASVARQNGYQGNYWDDEWRDNYQNKDVNYNRADAILYALWTLIQDTHTPARQSAIVQFASGLTDTP